MTSTTTAASALEREKRQTLAELYALLAKCFEHPSEAFYEAAQTGRFDAEVRTRLERLGVDVEPAPTLEASHGELREAYLRTFEGFDGPAAPPVESVHEPWWDGRERELLAGPAEADAKRRFEAIDAEVPARYPADHLAVLLEYASLVLEAGGDDEYADFHEHHLDWLETFAERVAAVDGAPYYRWAAETTARVVADAGERVTASVDTDGGEGR